MAIKDIVKRRLWAASGGFCAKPDCHGDLFPFFESGEITNIEELAHVIGQKIDGPRGNSSLPLSQRDEFNNIVLLCPTCHTIIDKNPLLFPEETILEWKKNHQQQIIDLFSSKKFTDRNSIRQYITPILYENRSIFNKFGPYSDNAKDNQMATELMWERLAIQKILPNNRKLEKIIECNLDLLTPDEIEIFTEFKIHREGFEYNKISGDVNATVLQFPLKFENILI